MYNFDCITDVIVKIITTYNLKLNYSLLGRGLGYDRYKLVKVIFNRNFETLQAILAVFSEQLQGFLHVLLTDNTKAVVVQLRLVGIKEQLHIKAEYFLSDFGFTFKSCIVSHYIVNVNWKVR